jgi:uncharacterized protein (TIGR02145 family)
MFFSKALLILAATVSVCMPQTIQISGVAKDSSTGVPIKGALVSLIHNGFFFNGLSDTTDLAGMFSLKGEPIAGIANGFKSVEHASPALSGHGDISFSLSEKGRVIVKTFSTQGKLIFSMEKMMQAGSHSISSGQIKSGIYLHKIHIGDEMFTLKHVTVDGIVKNAHGASYTESSSMTFAKSLKSTGVLIDTLLVSSDGYYPKRHAVSETVISGLQILCRKYADSVSDADGNVYHTVTIGTQTWMVENLKTTKYNDGSAIPLDTAWAYSWYEWAPSFYKKDYGALYSWHAVNTGKLAPSGWHVPTNAEWNSLVSFLGGFGAAGGKLKEAGMMHWFPNTGATNETGFSALPGGYRTPNGVFGGIQQFGSWWSSTQMDSAKAWDQDIEFDGSYIYNNEYSKKYGFSVRCIRN